MSSSTKLLRKYIREDVVTKHSSKKLWVFDFDDTLVKTDAKVHVIDAEGAAFDLTPGEFAVYEKFEGDVFDYTDFQKLINPRAIKWVNKILHNVHAHHGPGAIVILSARSSPIPIEQFLHDSELNDIEVIALDSADPLVKARWIEARIARDGYDAVEYLDDSHKNVAAVANLRHRLLNVRIVARHIIHNRIANFFSGSVTVV